jgi:uncharacterized protein (TIGR00369 family)
MDERPTDLDPLLTGFNRVIGQKVIAWQPGEAELRLTLRPEHLNSGGVVHGGVLMTLLDSACGFASAIDETSGARRYPMTLSFSTHFMATAREGDLRIVARKRGGGRNVFVCEASITNDAGDTVAIATGTYRYRSTKP